MTKKSVMVLTVGEALAGRPIAEVARRCQVNAQVLRALALGESLSVQFEVLARLCDGLDCEVGDLIRREVVDLPDRPAHATHPLVETPLPNRVLATARSLMDDASCVGRRAVAQALRASKARVDEAESELIEQGELEVYKDGRKCMWRLIR